MESREVIAGRLRWHPAKRVNDAWLRYEMLLVRRNGQFVAVRDHTAIAHATPQPHAVVHLSHVLVDPSLRRTGLAGWLRAWPIQTARSCLACAALPHSAPITLVAEMEHPHPDLPQRMIRLKAYEKAGFKKADPSRVQYFQPDFRPPAEIDASGGPVPLPFGLILRRLGREQETSVTGRELRHTVQALFQMYAENFRATDMEAARRAFVCPDDDTPVPLVLPTE
jgi:GNAT superfamily N-acetyltransferase